MPDLLAGTIVTALDTPPTVTNEQTGLFTFNATSFGIDADSGSYVDCGVAFVACTTGRATILYDAQLDNDTGGQFTACTPVVRTGAVVGAGATVIAASDDNSIVMSGTESVGAGRSKLITGLTPGDTYNVRLEHKVGGGIGTALRRVVTAAPAS